MAGYVKLTGFIIAALLVLCLPSLALGQEINFSVSPAETSIRHFPLGGTAEFELTIHNRDEVPHVFTLSTFAPPEEQRREGRAAFPDARWISFPHPKFEVPAKSQVNATVRVAVPREQKWADKNWETWLAVTTESADLLAVRLHVRLLVSTNPVVGARSNAGLVAGIVIGIILLGYGGYYYFRRKAKTK